MKKIFGFHCDVQETRKQFFQQTTSRDGRYVTPQINQDFLYGISMMGLRGSGRLQAPPRLGLGNPVYFFNPVAVMPASNSGYTVNYADPAPNAQLAPNRQMKMADTSGIMNASGCATCGERIMPVLVQNPLPSSIAPSQLSGNGSLSTGTQAQAGGSVVQTGGSVGSSTPTSGSGTSSTGGGAPPVSGATSSSSSTTSGTSGGQQVYPTVPYGGYGGGAGLVPSSPAQASYISSGSSVAMTSQGAMMVPKPYGAK